MNTFFKELFDYNHRSNQALIDIFAKQQNQMQQEAGKLLCHLEKAHREWNSRIRNTHNFLLPDILDLSDLRYIDKRNYYDSLLIIDEYDLSDTVEYRAAGERFFTDSVQDILFNIINHSTYHRGQIEVWCGSSGIAPPATDYLRFKDSSNAQPHTAGKPSKPVEAQC